MSDGRGLHKLWYIL